MNFKFLRKYGAPLINSRDHLNSPLGRTSRTIPIHRDWYWDKNIKNLNFFILAVLFLLGFALLYFLYYRQRNQSVIYVSLRVVSASGSQIQSGVSPYWVTDSINIGDKEISPLGGEKAQVLDKETYEAGSYVNYVYLKMKMIVIRDRSGIYLYNNKPLLVGDVVDMKLTKSHIQGLVIDVSKSILVDKFEKVKVTMIMESIDSRIAENIKVGSNIPDGKGGEAAKILEKRINPSNISFRNVSGEITNYGDSSQRKDVEIVMELKVKHTGSNYYFAQTQKIQVGEELIINFPDYTVNGIIVNLVSGEK